MKTTMIAVVTAALLCTSVRAATFEDQPAVNPPCGKGIGREVGEQLDRTEQQEERTWNVKWRPK